MLNSTLNGDYTILTKFCPLKSQSFTHVAPTFFRSIFHVFSRSDANLRRGPQCPQNSELDHIFCFTPKLFLTASSQLTIHILSISSEPHARGKPEITGESVVVNERGV